MSGGRTWSAAQIARLRKLYPNTRTRLITIPGRTRSQIQSQAKNQHLKKSRAFMRSAAARRLWTAAQRRELRKLYPDMQTKELAARLGRSIASILGQAFLLGIKKSAAFHASWLSGGISRFLDASALHRFPKGRVPWNKGLRQPGWAPGRMAESQFKKGHFPANRDPDYYVIGALRVSHGGYIDMRVSFEKGSSGWRPLHRIIWEDKYGPIPRGRALVFKDQDSLNVCLENLELITRAELMRRNSIHNLPEELKSTIHLLGRLKRRIHEKQDRRSA